MQGVRKVMVRSVFSSENRTLLVNTLSEVADCVVAIFRRPPTPEMPPLGNYHRSGTGTTVESLRDASAKPMGIPTMPF